MRGRASYARSPWLGSAGTAASLAFLLLWGAVALEAVPVTDVGITEAVEDELLYDRTVSLDRLDLSTADGIVTLTGTVDSLLAKKRAARIAQTVKGVRSVVNQIEVEPVPPQPDSDIEADVVTSLTIDPATEGFEIDVGVSDGTVTLTGTVDSWAERDLAEKVAKSVRGVKAMDNELGVADDAERTDAEIRAEIQKTFAWDLLVDDGLIDVSVQDGMVSLSGVVGSALEKTRAVANAWVAGVQDVDASGLEVARWARDDDLRKDKYLARTDAEIHEAVEDALARDPRVYSVDVETHSEDGVVTLRGVVDNLASKRAAGQDARNTVGVLDVVNRIKVRPQKLDTDEEIEARVEAALLRDSIVESHEVHVRVSGGRATLQGEVDSYFEKFHADDVASRVMGVVSVHNDLDVDEEVTTLYDPYLDPYFSAFGDEYEYPLVERRFTLRTDDEIEEAVNDELWWSPFVDADDVYVTVEDGVVTLIGTVQSWAEASAAIENAYEGGAVAIDNELVVSTSS